MKLYADVRNLFAARLRDDLGLLPNVIVGSPPCQDISCANPRGRGVDGERSGLFFEAIRIIGEVRPAWACLENSPNARTRGADRILAELEAIGYACWPLVVGAVHAGAPHLRKRVWIVAADTHGPGWQRGSRAFRRGLTCAGEDEEDGAPADAEVLARRERSGSDEPFAEPLARFGAPADSDLAGLAQREGLPGDPRPELAALERAVGPAGLEWNHGPDGHLRVDDGLPSGLARKIIAAYGDAVVPQITEAIGRTMKALLPGPVTVLDLFCGAAGGWSLGMARAGYDVVAACEIDPWRRSVTARRWMQDHLFASRSPS